MLEWRLSLGLALFLLCFSFLPPALQENLAFLKKKPFSSQVFVQSPRLFTYPWLEWDHLFPSNLKAEEIALTPPPHRKEELAFLAEEDKKQKPFSLLLLWDPLFDEPTPEGVISKVSFSCKNQTLWLSLLLTRNGKIYLGTDKRIGFLEGDFVNFHKVEDYLSALNRSFLEELPFLLRLKKGFLPSFLHPLEKAVKRAAYRAALGWLWLEEQREITKAELFSTPSPGKEVLERFLLYGDWSLLSKIGDKIPKKVWQHLYQKEDKVRNRALFASLFCATGRKALFSLFNPLHRKILLSFLKKHPKKKESLLSLLEKESSKVRYSLSLLLSELSLPASLLEKLLYHPHFSVNLAAAFLLWKQGKWEEVLPIFYAGLQYPLFASGKEGVRIQRETLRYLFAIGKKGKKYFLPYLEQKQLFLEGNELLRRKLLDLYKR